MRLPAFPQRQTAPSPLDPGEQNSVLTRRSSRISEEIPLTRQPTSSLRARLARMVDTKKVMHAPALRFEGAWSEAAEDLCRAWLESQAMHARSRVSHVALSRMKALEYERKHCHQLQADRRLLPETATRQDYYDAEIDAFLEAIGVDDVSAVLESFKLAGTGGLHRQHATVASTLTNAIGAAQLIVPDPLTKAALAGSRMALQITTAGTILQAGPRRLRNAGTEDILPLGRADAAPAAKVAPNVLQASREVIGHLKGAKKCLKKMQRAIDHLAEVQARATPDARALDDAKDQLELAFAKICHQLSVKSAYKASSESAKIEFWGNQRYLLSSYIGSTTTLTAGLIAILTPAVIAAPITGGLSAAAAALAIALYIGYQSSEGPSKDGEAKARRAIVALVKLVDVLSGENTSNLIDRAGAYQAYLNDRKYARFAAPEKKWPSSVLPKRGCSIVWPRLQKRIRPSQC